MTRKNHGADDRNRTRNLLITNQLLYQLSYIGNCTIDCVRHVGFEPTTYRLEVCYSIQLS